MPLEFASRIKLATVMMLGCKDCIKLRVAYAGLLEGPGDSMSAGTIAIVSKNSFIQLGPLVARQCRRGLVKIC